MSGRVVTLMALGGLLLPLCWGCGVGPGGLQRALTMQRVDPALALLRSFENHARLRKADDLYDLVRLFTPTCRLNCRGFVAHTVDRGGGYHIARWVPRLVGGTLLVDRRLPHGLGDLSRALASFGRLEVFEVRPLRLRRFPSRALVRARYRARGIDRAGALRVDSGLLDLDLVRRPGGWRIDGFVVARVHTLRRAGVAYSAGTTPKGKAGRGRPGRGRPRQLLFDDGSLLLLEGHGKTLWGRPLAGGPRRALLRLPRGPLVAIAAADVDGDGATDLCLASGGGDSGLYLRRKGGYRRVPGRLPGRAAACRIADLDGDGTLDLYLTRRGARGADPYAASGVSDLIARGPLGRSPLRITPSPAGKGWGRQACVADLDGDGRVEVLLVDELAPPRLLVGKRLVGGLGGAAAGCAFADVDGDGRLDVYLSTRGARSAFLFGRPGVGSPLRRGAAIAQSGGLWLNRSRPGKLRFRRSAALRDAAGWTGWAAFLDHDSDGDLDLWRRRHEPDALGEARWFWRVRGPGLRSGRSSASARQRLLGALRWRAQELWVNDGNGALSRGTFASGLVVEASGAGVAADLDGDDGRLDLLGGQVRQRWRGSEELLGEAGAGAAVLVHLRGAASNRDALGAVLRVRAQGRWQTRVVGSSSGWPGGPPGWVHIGLGAALRVERLEVRWPGGRRDVHEDLPVGKAIELSAGKPPRWRPFNARLSQGSSVPLRKEPPKGPASAQSAHTRAPGLAARLAGLSLSSSERLEARVPSKGVAAVVVSQAAVPAPICAALRGWKDARLFSVAPAATKGCGGLAPVGGARGGRWEVSPQTLRPFGALLPAVLLFRDGRLVKLWAAGAVPGALPPGG